MSHREIRVFVYIPGKEWVSTSVLLDRDTAPNFSYARKVVREAAERFAKGYPNWTFMIVAWDWEQAIPTHNIQWTE